MVDTTGKIAVGIAALTTGAIASGLRAQEPMNPADLSVYREVINLIAPLGVGGILAVVMFFWYRRDLAESRKDAAEMASRLQSIVGQVTRALEQSTQAHTEAVRESALTRQVLQDVQRRLELTDQRRVWDDHERREWRRQERERGDGT